MVTEMDFSFLAIFMTLDLHHVRYYKSVRKINVTVEGCENYALTLA